MVKEKTPAETAFQRFKKTRIWAFIEIASPIMGIIGGIILPIAIYFYSVKSGQLTVRGIQKSTLIDARNDIAKDVQCTYGNKTPIGNVTSFTLELANTGNTDIGKDDIQDLKWIPPSSSQILNAKIIAKKKDFGNFLSLDYADPAALRFNVLALNQGVSVTVTVLCLSQSPSIDSSTSHIEGVIRGGKSY